MPCRTHPTCLLSGIACSVGSRMLNKKLRMLNAQLRTHVLSASLKSYRCSGEVELVALAQRLGGCGEVRQRGGSVLLEVRWCRLDELREGGGHCRGWAGMEI